MKRISVKLLQPGMYIEDLSSEWMAHPFLRQQFLVKDDETIDKIIKAGIHEVVINPAKGLDVADAPTVQEAREKLESELVRVARDLGPARRITVREELGRAQAVYLHATEVVRSIMQDVRLGRQVKRDKVEPAVEQITASIIRNPDALLSLSRVKTKDEYTFQHSVAVGALQATFSRALGMDEDAVRLAGIGALLHDMGKVRVPDAILHKPGRLTEEEFTQMKQHAVESRKILEQAEGIHPTSVQVAYQHHERCDGSGYPRGLVKEDISVMGKMAAICDVYDAITSDRVYHKAMVPHEALRKMFEWSKFHFDAELVHEFVRIIGIYPVGTIVQLESGRIGLVMEQSEESLLTPTVRVFYDGRRRRPITPFTLDLSQPMGRGGADAIAAPIDPEGWGFEVPSLY